MSEFAEKPGGACRWGAIIAKGAGAHLEGKTPVKLLMLQALPTNLAQSCSWKCPCFHCLQQGITTGTASGSLMVPGVCPCTLLLLTSHRWVLNAEKQGVPLLTWWEDENHGKNFGNKSSRALLGVATGSFTDSLSSRIPGPPQLMRSEGGNLVSGGCQLGSANGV
eukprot:1154345-Pelagomonas_calceolata.AAC.1